MVGPNHRSANADPRYSNMRRLAEAFAGRKLRGPDPGNPHRLPPCAGLGVRHGQGSGLTDCKSAANDLRERAFLIASRGAEPSRSVGPSAFVGRICGRQRASAIDVVGPLPYFRPYAVPIDKGEHNAARGRSRTWRTICLSTNIAVATATRCLIAPSHLRSMAARVRAAPSVRARTWSKS